MCGLVVGDLDACIGQDLAKLLQRGARDTDGHAATIGPGVVERLHDAGKSLFNVDIRITQQVVLRDAGIVEADDCGVGGLDAELVLEAFDGHAGMLAGHDERLDRRPA